MSITFRCPACGSGVKVPDDRAGQPVECPQCGEALTAPGEGETLPGPPPVRMSPPEVMQYAGNIEGASNPAMTALRIVAVCGFAFVALAIVVGIVLPVLHVNRGLSWRTACAANLYGIGKGLHTYAADGNQGMPIAAHWPEKVAFATGQVNYVGRFGSKRGVVGSPLAGETFEVDGPDGREMSTTRNLWTLIRAGGATPGSFVCPESGDTKNDEDTPQDYWDFGAGDVKTAGPLPARQNTDAYTQVSYGYQVPYGKVGRPSAEGDQRAVLAADKGPYGVAVEMGAKAPPAFPAKLTVKSSPEDWRPWNSPNHGGVGNGEGQNVLFADSHVEWSNKPTAGPKYDNIYTRWPVPDASEAQAIHGNAPSAAAPNLTPLADTDGLIYP